MSLKPHPYADAFPMLPAGELDELVESIRSNGLRQPVVVTPDGLILDGRNRAAACERIGVGPETVVYDGDDLAEYVIDCNVTRRNMSTGARAMSTALVLAADGRREDGRWKRGSVQTDANGDSSTSAWIKAVQNAGVVLDFTPDLAVVVVNGEMALNAAYEQADKIRRSAESEKVRERELKKREKQEAQAEAERNAQIVAELTAAESRFLSQVEDGSMSPAVAWAAHLEDTRKERQAQEEIERGIRDTNTRIAECVRSLAMHAPGDLLVSGFLPHHDRVVVEGMRLTRERCEDAVTVLHALIKELNR